MSRRHPVPVRAAGRLFDLVLRAVAGPGRGRFAPEVRESFEDEASETYRDSGVVQLFAATCAAIADLVLSGRQSSPHRGGNVMSGLRQDLAYAFRIFRRQRGFTLGAVAMLALGIGANTALFTLVNAAVLRPLPYREADRLVRVWGAREGTGAARDPINPNDAADWRRGSPAIESLGVSSTTSQPLTGAEDPQMIPVAFVTSGFLGTLQVAPALGRLLGPEHDVTGRETDIVVTDGFWRRVLGGDPGVVGRTVRLSDVVCTIIGVLPPDFVSPGMRAGAEPQVWRPLVVAADNRGGHFVTGLARLKPGASLTEAEAQINIVAERLEREFPSTNLGQRAMLEPLQQAIAGDTRPAVLLLMAAVAVVLLIACANVANLLLARASAREREFAVRGAIGATRGRLLRQLLTESVLLGTAAAAAGIGVGWLLLQRVPAWLAEQLPTAMAATMDARVLSFSLLLSGLTVILFGLVPAVVASRHDLRGTLAAGSPGGGGGLRRFQSALVVIEAALALILLVSATFLVQSLVRLQRVDPGFAAAETLTFRVTLPRTRYPDAPRRNALFNTLIERLRERPGVTAAGGVNTSPLSGRNSCDSFGLADRPAPPEGQEPCAEVRVATPGYFTAMGIRLVGGRHLADADRAGTELVAVISESMARRYWPAGDAVGRRLKWGSVAAEAPWLTIVGVIGDVKHFGLNEQAPDEVYMPLEQLGASAFTFAVRTGYDAAPLRGEVRAIVSALDPALPVAELFTTSELVSRSVALPALRTQLLSAFAVLALLLAVSGVYAVVAFNVGQRQREMGIRLALGATPGEVRRLVIGRGMHTVGLGCAIGVVAAYPLVGLMGDVLFGVTPAEPLPYVIAPAALLATALVASYLPARRAAAFEPVDTLRRD